MSRERLELETSNLAGRLTTRGTDERNAKLCQGRCGKMSHDLLFIFWDFLHISGMVGAIYFKFGIQVDHQGY